MFEFLGCLGCLGAILAWLIGEAIAFGIVALVVWLVSLIIPGVIFSWGLALIVYGIIFLLSLIF